MTDPVQVQSFVIDAIARWAERQVVRPYPPRIDFRVVFGSLDIAVGVQARLAESKCAWFAVRSSGDANAVRLRNGHPPEKERPTWVPADAPFFYLVFWQPGVRGHASNAQSLADLRGVDVAQILADPEGFVLPLEREIEAQAEEAAKAWGRNAERAGEHLRLAWTAVRKCLRLGFGGVQRSIPFCRRLEDYGGFLHEARVPNDEWQATALKDRAALVVRRWGDALPRLSMFHVPRLASVLRVEVDPAKRPERRAEAFWESKLEKILAENIDAAVDPSSLHDRIAGKLTVEERLKQLKDIDLSSSAKQREARDALIKFCQDKDSNALSVVDWLFFKERSQVERASSLGLKGLLIARGGAQAWQPADPQAPESLEERAAQDVIAGNILLGLALLVRKNLLTETPDGALALEPRSQPGELLRLKLLDCETTTSTEIPAGEWGSKTRDTIQQWMMNDVRKAVFAAQEDEKDPEDEDPEAEEEQEFIRIGVERGAGGEWKRMGTMRLEWSPRGQRHVENTLKEALTLWACDREGPGNVGPARLLETLFGAEASSKPVARSTHELNEAWEGYRKSFGPARGWPAMAILAPVGAGGREWVKAWANAVAGIAAGGAEKRRELEKQRDEAIRNRQFTELPRLQAELDTLGPANAAPEPTLDDVRSILGACTGSLRDGEGAARLVLTPHHPLSLRLRALSDIVLCEILTALWTDGWHKDELNILDNELNGWGLPEPVHTYGFQSSQPLVFEGWLSERSQFALFSRLGAGRDADARSLGVKQVAGVVGRYKKLFPAASHRLRVRITGDREGRWAWEILDLLRNDKGAYDIGLVTSLPPRESSAIERAIQGDEERRQAFEPGEEGVVPRIRVRRLLNDLENDERVHLALVVGDEVPAFRPELRTEPGKPGSTDDLWNTRVFFEETRPELFEASIAVGDRNDSLSRNVARAVGFAMGQRGGLVFRETYNFDRDRCKKPLGKIQSGAHWLVLASRQPLYRAVQKAGPDVTALLDFYSTIERGRTVHVCASLNADSASDDLRRLDAAVTALFGPDPAGWGAQALVAAATRFAPGLAMRCAGAVSAADVEGLIGLLLTGHEARRANPGAVVLSLDQDEHLLVPGGQKGDILIVKSQGNGLSIAVGESKFSACSVDANSAPVSNARKQISSSVSRLRRLAAQHPLSARVRSKLAGALIRQIHLTDAGQQRADELKDLVQAAADPARPIAVEPESEGAIHVWSVDEGTADAVVTGQPGAAPVYMHGRAATIDKLRELGGRGGLRETVLEIGAEGGSVTISRERKAGEDWRFQMKTDETALEGFLSEEDQGMNLVEQSGYVHSFHEALGLLNDRYPGWFGSYLLKVHPEFLDTVLLEVRKRGGPTEETRWRERLKEIEQTPAVQF